MTDASGEVEQQRAADSDLVPALRRTWGCRLVGQLYRRLERGGELIPTLGGAELTGSKAQLIALDRVRAARQLRVEVVLAPPGSPAQPQAPE